MARVGEDLLLSVTLLDLKKSSVVHRASRRIVGGSMSALLDQVPEVAFELANADPVRAGKPALAPERQFGGVVAAVRGDADLVGAAATPAITAIFSGRRFGVAVTVLTKLTPGLRVEGRYFPVELGRVRPFIAAGATAFAAAVGIRGAGGVEARFGQVDVFADVAYEHFPNAELAHYRPAAVLLGCGVGWMF